MANYAKRTITVDSQGRKTVVEDQYTVRRDPQDYFSLYVDGLSDVLLNITSANEIKVLLALCSMTKFNTNVVPVTKAERKKLAEMINSTEGSISNALTALCQMGYISKMHGNYTISHHLFWRGDTKKRQALLNSTSKQTLADVGKDFLEVPNQSTDDAEQLNS